MKHFNDITIKQFHIDPFALKNKWMLITAAKPDGTVNTMTASWGGFGIMWNKEVCFVVIRPQRYTREFVESSECISLSFFGDEYKKALSYLGTVSGRDEDKIRKMGLTVKDNEAIPYFEEAETVILVKKLFVQKMEENAFIDKSIIDKWYPEKDFHYLYIAEITKVFQQKG